MSLFFTLLPVYLFGNIHCAGMCGPLMMLLAKNRYRWAYFAGRLVSYTLAGLLSAEIGMFFFSSALTVALLSFSFDSLRMRHYLPGCMHIFPNSVSRRQVACPENGEPIPSSDKASDPIRPLSCVFIRRMHSLASLRTDAHRFLSLCIERRTFSWFCERLFVRPPYLPFTCAEHECV